MIEGISLVQFCIPCDRRQQSCNGPCACLADPDIPVDIIDRALSGVCPLDRFDPNCIPPKVTQKIPLAGDIVAAVTAATGADRLAKWWARMSGKDCRCDKRRAWLNRIDGKLRSRFT